MTKAEGFTLSANRPDDGHVNGEEALKLVDGELRRCRIVDNLSDVICRVEFLDGGHAGETMLVNKLSLKKANGAAL